jgi:type IV secretory pathway VirD2 relaxase
MTGHLVPRLTKPSEILILPTVLRKTLVTGNGQVKHLKGALDGALFPSRNGDEDGSHETNEGRASEADGKSGERSRKTTLLPLHDRRSLPESETSEAVESLSVHVTI